MQQDSITDSLLQAQLSYQANHFDEAIHFIHQCLDISHSNYTVYFYKALIEIAQGKYEDALQSLDQSLKLKPNFKQATIIKIEILILRRNYEEAQQTIESILQNDMNNEEANNYLGIIKGRLGFKEEAIQYFDRCISINPKNSNYFYNKGCYSISKELMNNEYIKNIEQAQDLQIIHHITQLHKSNEMNASFENRLSKLEQTIEKFQSRVRRLKKYKRFRDLESRIKYEAQLETINVGQIYEYQQTFYWTLLGYLTAYTQDIDRRSNLTILFENAVHFVLRKLKEKVFIFQIDVFTYLDKLLTQSDKKKQQAFQLVIRKRPEFTDFKSIENQVFEASAQIILDQNYRKKIEARANEKPSEEELKKRYSNIWDLINVIQDKQIKKWVGNAQTALYLEPNLMAMNDVYRVLAFTYEYNEIIIEKQMTYATQVTQCVLS